MIASIEIISDNRVDIRFEDVFCGAYNHDFYIKVVGESFSDLINKLILTLAKIDVRMPILQLNNSPEILTEANLLKLQIFEAMHQLATESKIEYDGNTDVRLVIRKELN